MEHSNVRLLLSNAIKNCLWVRYTFLKRLSSFKFLSISEEICGADITNISKIFSWELQMLQKSLKLQSEMQNGVKNKVSFSTQMAISQYSNLPFSLTLVKEKVPGNFFILHLTTILLIRLFLKKDIWKRKNSVYQSRTFPFNHLICSEKVFEMEPPFSWTHQMLVFE